VIGVDTDVDTFAAAMADAGTDLAGAVATADGTVSELVGRASLSTVPTDTGALYRSGVFGGGHIIYTADHAVPVLGGTATMPARPWVFDAWENQQPAVLETYDDAVTGVLAGVD
jgi:enhancing lycopene biosynthesis protein 2